MRTVVVLFGEELADLSGSGVGSLGACDGGFDDGRQMKDFFALTCLVMTFIINPGKTTNRICTTRFAEESLLA